MGNLEGKVVVVIGAGRGLGRAFALGFASEGAVVLVGRRRGPERDPETLDHAAGLIASEGGETLSCQGSVDDIAAMQQLVYEATARFGGIDILVNNAGLYHPENFSSTTLAQWNEVMGGFLTGPFVCSKVVAPSMMQRGGGSIIHLGSYAATSNDANAFRLRCGARCHGSLDEEDGGRPSASWHCRELLRSGLHAHGAGCPGAGESSSP